MSKREKAIDYAAELESLYERWDYLYEHGGFDPTWSDGANLSLLKSQIISCKRKIEEQNTMFLLPDAYYKELPPDVPMDYMARPDEIRENAQKAMAIIDADENLKFVHEQSKNLSEKQSKRLCIPAILGYAENIRKAIAEDDLITMRRYENPDRYLDSFRSAAEKLHSPEISENENRQLPAYEAEDEEEFNDDFEEEYSETEQLETEEITVSINDPEEDFQLKFF